MSLSWEQTKEYVENLKGKEKQSFEFLFLKYCQSGMDGHNATVSALDKYLEILDERIKERENNH